MMKKINWGIIGCGDVTELKSGPAFNKVSDSALTAVMRRDEEKVKDYARRHDVPKWYTNAYSLINDPDVDAIYVATPPSSHEEYTVAALTAGKPVYVEKPMSVDTASAKRMAGKARETKVKLVVAHYRRAQPLYRKVKELLDNKTIGEVRFVKSDIWKRALSKEELAVPKTAWRIDPKTAGGGLFHDLSPHQLDLMYYFFGEPATISGMSVNQAMAYDADDMVAGSILFKSGVVFNGLWCFSLISAMEKDSCEIVGDKGKISFSFFEQQPVTLTIGDKIEQFSFEALQHVQQPMIEKVVDYFLGRGNNPCSGDEGVKVMEMIEGFSGK